MLDKLGIDSVVSILSYSTVPYFFSLIFLRELVVLCLGCLYCVWCIVGSGVPYFAKERVRGFSVPY